MNTVVGAIVWCYDMTVEDDPPGTYYLPSFAELVVFNDHLDTLKAVRPDLITSLKGASTWYWTCNFHGSTGNKMWYGAYLNGNKRLEDSINPFSARCVRQKD